MNGEAPHIPVMLDEVLHALGELRGRNVLDGTFGAGGYSHAFLAKGAQVIAFDRDPDASRTAEDFNSTHGSAFAFKALPFSLMAEVLAPSSVDAVVLDVGVSSMQIDRGERGFSFMRDGPLDMRMAQVGPTAADVVNTYSVSDLIRIIGILGEDRNAPKIAHAIVDARVDAPFETTKGLVSVIEKAAPKRGKDKIHPATRTFQGLRIFVNDELRELARALFAAEAILKDGGRLVVVSFHSLEDRIVKQYLTDRMSNASGSRHLPVSAPKPLLYKSNGKSVISASADEAARNPRARSAKLRAVTRTDAAPRDEDFSIFQLPHLPWIDARAVVSTSQARGVNAC
ncbi:MAG: 16S rRNA (cytosine(1402)-N(4))-methyltransferase RsmH [Pseudomonadota bacterium]